MHRAATLALVSICLLAPRAARAEDDSPLARVQNWFSQLGKPQPPQPPPEDPSAWNTFTINPFAIRYQQLGLEYEHAFGGVFSLFVSPELTYGGTASAWQLSAGGTLGARIFVLGKAPGGIFFAPEVNVQYQRQYRGGVMQQAVGVGLGGGVGFTLVFFNRFTVSAGFAAQYRSVPDLESPEPGAVRVELVPIPRLAFGVAF